MLDSYSDDDDEVVKAPGQDLTQVLAQALQSHNPPPVTPTDALVEVQRRLDMAACYKMLLSDTFFAGESETTRLVEAELREFVHSRLKVLVGLGAAPAAVASGFTSAEVSALKALARSVLGQAAKSQPAQVPAISKKGKGKSSPSPKEQVNRVSPPASVPAKASKASSKAPERAKRPAPPTAFLPPGVAPVAALSPTGAIPPVVPETKNETKPGQKFSTEEYQVASADKNGNIEVRKIRLNITPQVRPAGVLGARFPSKHEFETLVNGAATQEAEEHAAGFNVALQKSRTMPITRRGV